MMRLFCCSHLLALQCIRYCLISDIRLLRWQWNFKEKSPRLQTCQKISDKYISVSMIRVSTSLRKNPLPGMTKFCATLILLVLIQLHHCLHHGKMKPEETSSPEGKVAQPVKRSDELSLIRFLNSSQMEQPVKSHILNLKKTGSLEDWRFPWAQPALWHQPALLVQEIRRGAPFNMFLRWWQ